MSSGLRSSVQNPRNGEWRSVIIGARACRSFETEPSRTRICMPLRQFLQGLGHVRRFVVGANSCREIAVEVEPTQKRRVSVDAPVLESGELGETGRVSREHARKVHEFGEAENFGMIGERRQIVRPRAWRPRSPDVSRERNWRAGPEGPSPKSARSRESSEAPLRRARWRFRGDRKWMSLRHVEARSDRTRAASRARIRHGNGRR